MNAALSAGLRKVAIALAHIWYFAERAGDQDWGTFYVYARDLDTVRLDGQRIKVHFEIEPLAGYPPLTGTADSPQDRAAEADDPRKSEKLPPDGGEW